MQWIWPALSAVMAGLLAREALRRRRERRERERREKEHAAELEAARVKLRDEDAELERFFSIALDLLCIADTEGRFRRVNRAWETLLGFSREELTSRRFLEFVHPDDMASTLDAIEALKAQKDVIGFINRYRCKDGSYRWIEWHTAPAGELIYAAARDITERRQMERSLVEALNLNERMIAASPIGILAYRASGECILANDAVTRIVGGERRQLLAQNFRQLESWKTSDLLAMAVVTLESRQTLRRQTHVVTSFGRRIWLDCFMTTFTRGNEVKLLVMLHDITDLKAAEAALVAARDSAEAANRAKDVFLANMSHEIRTPLNAIIGFAELLSALPLDEKQRAYVDPIRTAGQSLLRLLNDLLDLSKIEAGRMELSLSRVNLRALLQEIEVIFAARVAQKGIQLATDVDGGVPDELMLDEIRMRQVLVNVVGNAVKFTDRGGVRVRVARHEASQPTDAFELAIDVEDTGIGIPVADQEHIFEAFRQQGDQDTTRYGGTGLGLTISRRLVEMMRGSLTLDSEPGRGSVFHIRIGDVRAASAAAGPAAGPRGLPPISDYRFAGQRVLVVDDVESNRAMLRALLEQAGLRVVEAQDGASALGIANEIRPDLIVMDIRMPGMDGAEAARLLHADDRTRAIPILALTAMPREAARLATAGDLFAALLAKPLPAAAILREVSRILAGDAHAPAAWAGGAAEACAPIAPVQVAPAEREALLAGTDALAKGLVLGRVHDLVARLREAGRHDDTGALRRLAGELEDGARTFDIGSVNRVLVRLGNTLRAAHPPPAGASAPNATEPP